MTIYLCGFMGCGKSTVGKQLSELSGVPFCDLDDVIVKEYGAPIPQIFAEKGEAFFRELEANLLRQQTGIVATGGGALLNDISAAYAKENGVTVYIDTPFEICFERIKSDKNRPIAASSTREQLLERYSYREPIYRRNSELIVAGMLSAREIAERILYYIDLKGKANEDI